MLTYLKEISPYDKTVLDVLSITAVLGTLTSILPHIAALFTIIWTGIRIYETPTVQKWFKFPLNKSDSE